MTRSLMIVLAIGMLVSMTAAETLESRVCNWAVVEYSLDTTVIEVTMHRSMLQHELVDDFRVEIKAMTKSEPRGRFPLYVSLYDGEQLIEKGSVSLDVRHYADILVPRYNIDRHAHLAPEMFETDRIDITSLTEPLLTEPSHLKDTRAVMNLMAGRMVPLKRVERIPDVLFGEAVTVLAISPMLEITARGEALENGHVGEPIRVRIRDTHKIITGTITGPGQVEYQL